MFTTHTHTHTHTHTKSLYVMDSNIRGAGKGLFTDEVIEKDSFICPYGGELYTDEEFDDLPTKQKEYGVRLKRGWIITAHLKKHSKHGRYANNRPKKNNAKLVRDQITKTASIQSTRRIEKGEEIYVAYGRGFWKNRKRKKTRN